MTRAEELTVAGAVARACTSCALAKTRTHVVFGAGNPGADLMLIGEGPGYLEDAVGRPFAGTAGIVLERLLASIGLTCDDVWLTNVLLCRPPGNRNPEPAEIQACARHLYAQANLVEPHVVVPLGAFAAKLISGRATSITRAHGHELEVRFGKRLVIVYPLLHPALAVHAPPMRPLIERAFRRIPELLEREIVDEHAAEETPEAEQLALLEVAGTGRGFAE